VRDRLHITTLYYDLATGDVKKAIASYKEWVRLYPRDDIAKGICPRSISCRRLRAGCFVSSTGAPPRPRQCCWYENLATAYIALQRLEEAQNILKLPLRATG